MGQTLFERMHHLAARDTRQLRDREPAPSAFDDLGPNMPSRGAVYRQAREVEQLAKLAAELSESGPRQDVRRALAQLDKIRAILGAGHE